MEFRKIVTMTLYARQQKIHRCKKQSFGLCGRRRVGWFERIAEKAMAPHSSTLAWKIPWMEEPGGLQSMGSLRVGHDWAISLSLFTFMHWRSKWQPTPVFLPGESQGRRAWWAAVYGIAQSRIRLKRLSSSKSSSFIYLIRNDSNAFFLIAE